MSSRFTFVDACGTGHYRRNMPRKLPSGWVVSPTGANFSVRRDTALRAGLFDENYSYFLEESDLLWRLQRDGKCVRFAPEAEVHHGYAASALRDDLGIPRSLYAIARSKAYFCAVNRQTHISDAVVSWALRDLTLERYKLMALGWCSES